MTGHGTSDERYARAAALLQGGDAGGARALLLEMQAHSGGLMDQRGAWLLAQACRRLDDLAGEMAAIHLILADAPRDLAALLAMGDAFARQEDERAAASWFRLALAQAELTPPTPRLVPLLQRAQQYCAQAQQRFTEYMLTEIERIGVRNQGSPALAHAIALLTGQAQIHLQQPSMFYYPGLPQRCFYERHEFGWVPALESAAARLREEYLALAEQPGAFAPYVERSTSRPAPNNALLEDDSWGAAYLWRGGSVTALGQQAPATLSALEAAELPYIAGRSPMALYSRLRPGTHIAPHHGLLNTRLICHLPLIAPEGCALRVGHETREWRFSEMLIFDDSIEHEAWNRGTADRTILLFEIWRPEIPADDRALLARLFEAIDRIDPALGREQS